MDTNFLQPTPTTPDANGFYQINLLPSTLNQEGARIHVKVAGRFVSIVRGRAYKLYCIDAVCYHMGGPLTIGDIEEVNGEICIKCPWHHYNVTLDTGAKLYQKMDFDAKTKKLVPAGWQASERRQRVHNVEEREGYPDVVYVQLTSNDKSATRHQEADTLDYVSDKWAYNAGAANNVCRSGNGNGGGGGGGGGIGGSDDGSSDGGGKTNSNRRSGDGKHPRSMGRGGMGMGGGDGKHPSLIGRGGGGRFGNSSGNSNTSTNSSGNHGYRPSGQILADARAKNQKNLNLNANPNKNRQRTLPKSLSKNNRQAIQYDASPGSLPSFSSSLTSSSLTSSISEEYKMQPDQWLSYPLLNKKRLSSDMYLYRFSLPSSNDSLGWIEIERHLRIRGVSLKNGAMVMREYTPISNPSSTNGTFDIAIKLYPNGEMSNIFSNLKIGDSLEMCGPFGNVTIQEDDSGEQGKEDVLEISSLSMATPKSIHRITMLAAGSGITPMIQILNVMISSFSSNAYPIIDIIISNKYLTDICFTLHLEKMQERWSKTFNILHLLSQEKEIDETKYDQNNIQLGRINIDVMEKIVKSEELRRENEGSSGGGGGGGEKTNNGLARANGHVWLVCGSRNFEVAMKATLVQGLHVNDENVMMF